MCGRFTQYRPPQRYAQEIGLSADQLVLLHAAHAKERYNIASGAHAHVMHIAHGLLHDVEVPWGWGPMRSDVKAINARVESVASTPFWKPIWPSGRAIVGIDGWYEWKKHPDIETITQPYYIRLKSGAPMLVAAIGELPDGIDPPNRGFAMLTGAADKGFVDAHARKPLLLPADLARTWLSEATTPEDALSIVEHRVLQAADFEWFPVGKAIEHPSNQGPELIEEISNPML